MSLMFSAGIEAGRFSAIAVSCPGSAGGPAKRSVRKPWSAVEFPRTAAASPNCEDGVTVRVGVIVTVMDGLDELVIEGLIDALTEALLVVVAEDDFVGVNVFVDVTLELVLAEADADWEALGDPETEFVGVAVFEGVVVDEAVIETLDEAVIDGLIVELTEGLLEVV